MKRYIIALLIPIVLAALVVTTTSRAAPEAFITVTSTADVIAADGACTLREAITATNTNMIVNECPAGSVGLDTIEFAIGSIGAQQTISLTAALPAVADPLFIDGWSQGGAGYAGPPLIEINGGAIATWNTTDGLRITAGSSTVRGLVINTFNIAINLTTNGNNIIAGNYLGLALDGDTPIGNRTGIRISAASDGNRIGTNSDGVDDAAERNVISASGFVQQNNSSGILIDQGSDSVVPEVVHEDAEGYKYIRYQFLTALLVEAIKEQYTLLQTLSGQVAALAAQ